MLHNTIVPGRRLSVCLSVFFSLRFSLFAVRFRAESNGSANLLFSSVCYLSGVQKRAAKSDQNKIHNAERKANNARSRVKNIKDEQRTCCSSSHDP